MTAGHFWERSLQPAFEIAAQHALDRLPPKERDAVFSRFVPESGRAVFEILQWWLDVTRATEVPAVNVTCPVLCAAGGHDRVNPAESVRRVAARYRGDTTYKEYPEMSHWLIGEPGWEEVASDVLLWLDRLEN
jgi:non-heme chloroperoxidase